MTQLSYSQLESVWLAAARGTQYATAEWAALMAAIGLAESQGNTDATNPNDNNGAQTSWGTWQISLGNHNPPDPQWNNPYVNARLAIGKLNNPSGLRNWGTFVSGAYKKYYKGNIPASNAGIPANSNSAAQLPSSNPYPGGSLNPLNWPSQAGSGFLKTLLAGLGLSDLRDLAVRGGLIILGALMLLVGIVVLTGRGTASTALTVAAPESKAAQFATGARQRQYRKKTEQAARKQVNP